MSLKSSIYKGPSLTTEDDPTGAFPGKLLSQFGAFRRCKYKISDNEVEQVAKVMTDEDCEKLVLRNKERIMSDFREWIKSN